MEQYLKTDLEDILYGRKTFDDIAKKYGSKPSNVRRAFNRNGYRLTNRKIVIKNNLTKECIVVESISVCARELNVSRQTIYSALKGKKIRLLDELNVEVKIL